MFCNKERTNIGFIFSVKVSEEINYPTKPRSNLPDMKPIRITAIRSTVFKLISIIPVIIASRKHIHFNDVIELCMCVVLQTKLPRVIYATSFIPNSNLIDIAKEFCQKFKS